MLCNYMGEKTHQLAYAINWLAYHAGGYDRFIDLFGGGGIVSASIIKNDNSEYFINEIDPFVVNYYRVLQNKSEELINEIKELQKEFNKKKTDNEKAEYSSELYKKYKSLKNNYNSKTDVKAAVAYVFFQSFLFQGKQCDSTSVKYKRNIKNFEQCDFTEQIMHLHKQFSRLVVLDYDATGRGNSEMSFIDACVKFSMPGMLTHKWGSRCLLYSDSPYESTKGYKQKFNPQMMDTLIKDLCNSGHKYIFSCRVGCTKVNFLEDAWYAFCEDDEGHYVESEDEKYKEVWKANTNIYFNVFKKFEKYKMQQLYVLCIIQWGADKTSRPTLNCELPVQNTVEVMICNYKFSNPMDYKRKSDGRIFIFETYEYQDFMDKLNENNYIRGSYPIK